MELLSNFEIAHGAAVSIGMAVAVELGIMTKRIPKDYAERQNNLLMKLGLPIRIPSDFNPEKIYEAMLHDKKTIASKIKLILPDGAGAVSIVDDTDSDLIIQAIRNCCD